MRFVISEMIGIRLRSCGKRSLRRSKAIVDVLVRHLSLTIIEMASSVSKVDISPANHSDDLVDDSYEVRSLNE